MATEEKNIDEKLTDNHTNTTENNPLTPVHRKQIENLDKVANNNNESDNENETTSLTSPTKIEREKSYQENKLLNLSNAIQMPNLSRLKSTLASPKNLISPKIGYNTIEKTVTGSTIKNDLKSSVDITLYDNDLDNTDDNATQSKTRSFSDLNVHKKINVYNNTETWNSMDDVYEDFLDEEDEYTLRINSNITNDDDIIRCNCFKWSNKYKKSLIFTLVLCLLMLIVQIIVDRDNMKIVVVYIEFILMIMTLFFLFRIVWGLISYWLFVCTARNWCRYKYFNVATFIFYIHHSGTYISYSLLSTTCFVVFAYFKHNSAEFGHFGVSGFIKNADAEVVEFIERIFLCCMVLFYGLFLKTILIRWVCLTYYLSSHLIKIKKFKKYESWLKILLKSRQLFSIKVKKFLDINELHNSHQDTNLQGTKKTVAFRLSILAYQTEFNLSSEHASQKLNVSNNMDKIDEVYNDFDSNDQDNDNDNDDDIAELYSNLHDSVNNKLVNTLTGTMLNISSKKYAHNTQTCLLWLYNASTDKVTMIDDNELDKVCKMFTKYIVASVTKKRFDAKTPKAFDVKPKPSFSEITTMFRNRYSKTMSDTEQDKNGENIGGTLHIPTRLNRSLMTVGGEFIQQNEFIRCFTRLNKTKQGYEAWKEINMSDKLLTKKELQRWLYQYFHDLIYLKQTLNSYQEILSNLDMSTNIIAIFVLFFIFLLIFEFNFIDSVSIYFSMIAIFAVFGKNVFTQFFDALYFIFILAPFEIGDVVLIDNIRYTINKIHIMSTEMITSVSDGNTICIKNNAKLLNNDIQNLSRTKSPYHNITFYISQDTSINQLNQLKLKIDTFIRRKMKNDINDIWFILDGVDKECRMKISLFLGSIYPFSDSGLMWKQYHLINLQIRKYINQMGIQYKRFSSQDVQLSALIEDDEIKKQQK